MTTEAKGRLERGARVLELLHAPMLLGRSLVSRWMAARAGLPGLQFDSFGRHLALRELYRSPSNARVAFKDFVHPVSSVRYFEFDFAERALVAGGQRQPGRRLLDISSPRLLPLRLAAKDRIAVTMINPDRSDLARSADLARHLPGPLDLEIGEDVDATALPFRDGVLDKRLYHGASLAPSRRPTAGHMAADWRIVRPLAI